MKLTNLAYAKLNLEFDREEFTQEYDKVIIPLSKRRANYYDHMLETRELNKVWGMVPDEIYDQSDCVNVTNQTKQFVQGTHRSWLAYQMLEIANIDTIVNIATPTSKSLVESIKNKDWAASRMATLDAEYKLKDECKDLKIVKWIYENLPFSKLNSISCVALQPNSFSVIHRDRFYQKTEINPVHNIIARKGYIIINISITDGGSPLWWSLDNDMVKTSFKVYDKVFLTNDHFLHGVSLCSSTRRQIRVCGKPTDNFLKLLDSNTIIDLGNDYNYSNKIII